MSISATLAQFKLSGANRIPRSALTYICARARLRAHDLLVREFKKSGLTQADLAARLGRTADVISRMLSRPANWEIDTFSAAIFAVTGGMLTFEIRRPVEVSLRLTGSPNLDIEMSDAETNTVVTLDFKAAA